MLKHLSPFVLIALLSQSCGSGDSDKNPKKNNRGKKAGSVEEALSSLSTADRNKFEQWKSSLEKSCDPKDMLANYKDSQGLRPFEDSEPSQSDVIKGLDKKQLDPLIPTNTFSDQNFLYLLSQEQYSYSGHQESTGSYQSNGKTVTDYSVKFSGAECSVSFFGVEVYKTTFIKSVKVNGKIPKKAENLPTYFVNNLKSSDTTLTYEISKNDRTNKTVGGLKHTIDLAYIFSFDSYENEEGENPVPTISTIPNNYIKASSLSLTDQSTTYVKVKDPTQVDPKAALPTVSYLNTRYLYEADIQEINIEENKKSLELEWSFNWKNANNEDTHHEIELDVTLDIHNKFKSEINDKQKEFILKTKAVIDRVEIVQEPQAKNILDCYNSIVEAEELYARNFILSDSRPDLGHIAQLCQSSLPKGGNPLNHPDILNFALTKYLVHDFNKIGGSTKTSCSINFRDQNSPYNCYNRLLDINEYYTPDKLRSQTFQSWGKYFVEFINDIFYSDEFEENYLKFESIVNQYPQSIALSSSMRLLQKVLPEIRKQENPVVKNYLANKLIEIGIEAHLKTFEKSTLQSMLINEDARLFTSIYKAHPDLQERAQRLYFSTYITYNDKKMDEETLKQYETRLVLFNKLIDENNQDKNVNLKNNYTLFRSHDYLSDLESSVIYNDIKDGWYKLDSTHLDKANKWLEIMLEMYEATKENKPSIFSISARLQDILEYSYVNEWKKEDFQKMNKIIKMLNTPEPREYTEICNPEGIIFQRKSNCLSTLQNYLADTEKKDYIKILEKVKNLSLTFKGPNYLDTLYHEFKDFDKPLQNCSQESTDTSFNRAKDLIKEFNDTVRDEWKLPGDYRNTMDEVINLFKPCN